MRPRSPALAPLWAKPDPVGAGQCLAKGQPGGFGDKETETQENVSNLSKCVQLIK